MIAGRAFTAQDAVEAAQSSAFNLSVRTRGIEPAAYARRLRELAIQTSTELIVDEPIALDDALAQEQGLMRMVAIVVLLGTLSVLLLSAARIYALTSFVVAKRRCEVAIRAALGAQPAQLCARSSRTQPRSSPPV